MTDDPPLVIGIPWYRREDYPAVLAIMHDAQLLPSTWEEWHEIAERVERDMKASDHLVIRIAIDPETFPAWCLAHGLNVDAEARSRFAAEATRR